MTARLTLDWSTSVSTRSRVSSEPSSGCDTNCSKDGMDKTMPGAIASGEEYQPLSIHRIDTSQHVRATLAALRSDHRAALEWFLKFAGTVQPWPAPLGDGTRMATQAKGIYKPKGLDYAVSVRETLGHPYPDLRPVVSDEGVWAYRYFQEGREPSERDSKFTNRGLMACLRDSIPVGVMRQVSGKPQVRYDIWGLASVVAWEAGYFCLEGLNLRETHQGDARHGVSGR